MLKGDILFVPAERRIVRLPGRLCFCLIFQFQIFMWDGIIHPDPDSASSAVTVNAAGYMTSHEKASAGIKCFSIIPT